MLICEVGFWVVCICLVISLVNVLVMIVKVLGFSCEVSCEVVVNW